ncbi:Exosome component Rrp46 [Mycena chlorophos]|uniref:Exosome component Rrp46 n=1 Tax=Mycena chlorophos TaxID=658473 RepID=A0A8H6WIT2_MYCCL|nr:Exosome component Rrp46 [Mycena chlorophos]
MSQARSTLRPMSTTFDRLARVDGSARFAFGTIRLHSPVKFALTRLAGDTAALASVSGPIEVRIAAENPSAATLEVLHRPLSGIPGTQSKVLAGGIRSALLPALILTQNPRTLVQLVVQSLSTTGGTQDALVAACINAGSLALLNAGSVPMRGVVCAVAVGRSKDGTMFLDPDEADVLDASGCFAFMFERGEDDARCVWSSWRATSGMPVAGAGIGEGDLKSMRRLALVGAREVWKHVRGVFAGSEDDEDDGMEE